MGDGRRSETVSSSGNRDLVRRGGARQLEDVDGNGDFRDTREERPVNEGSSRDLDGPRIEVDVSNNAVIVRDRPESMEIGRASCRERV